MHVIWLILKIVGILVLVLIGLFLVILYSVLFVAASYKSKGYTLRRGICGMVLSGGVDTMLLGQCKRLGEEFTGSAAFLFRSRR